MKKVPFLATLILGIVLLAATGCQTPTQGAVTGGILGAGTGAVIGNQSHHQGEGALIGAGAGALAGALLGNDNQKNAQTHQVQQPTAAPRDTHETVVTGHYELRRVRTDSGETYEERVWVPDR